MKKTLDVALWSEHNTTFANYFRILHPIMIEITVNY